MIPKLSMFVIQGAAVLLMVAFHLLAARLFLRRLRLSSPVARRWVLWLLGALVLLLDVPLVHTFILYKEYHPLVLDELMHRWAAPFIALHANAFLFGGGLIADHYLLRPIWRRLRRKGREGEKSPATPTETAGALAVQGGGALALDPGYQPVPPRRRFLYTAGFAAVGYAASASTLSAMDSTDDYRIEQAVIKIPNLPEKLKGTTIALISDIHSSVFMNRQDMERYVKVVNDLKTDLTVVTGDFVNSKLREVYPFAEAFTGLHAPLGVYGVTGNHDYYTREIETVAREVEQCGIKLLRNQNLSIEKNGEKLWLLGMDDGNIYDVKPYLESGRSPRGTIENMLSGVPEKAPKIFLCHKPYPFEEYSMLGMDLMLSGHTHGGQVVIAQLDNVNLSFASLASRYLAGLYRARSNRTSQLYVTRGIGTVGLPLRLNCPPEVTRIVLV